MDQTFIKLLCLKGLKLTRPINITTYFLYIIVFFYHFVLFYERFKFLINILNIVVNL